MVEVVGAEGKSREEAYNEVLQEITRGKLKIPSVKVKMGGKKGYSHLWDK